MLHDMNGWFLMAELVAKYNIHSWILLAYRSKVYGPWKLAVRWVQPCMPGFPVNVCPLCWGEGTLQKKARPCSPFKTKVIWVIWVTGVGLVGLKVSGFATKSDREKKHWDDIFAFWQNGRVNPQNKFHLTTSIRMCGQNLHVKNFPNQNSQPQEKHRCFMDLCKVELLHKDRKNSVGQLENLEIMWVTKSAKYPTWFT